MFCIQPFNRIEIYENGDVFNCCPPFINNYKIGNIYEKSFDEIWNSEEVQVLRRNILNGDFCLCNDICNKKYSNEENNKYKSEIVDEYPEEISISSDSFCNVKCKICRDKNTYVPFNKETLVEEIENLWIPILKNAKLVRFGCSGEPFSSYKETMIIKKTAEKYPNAKFHIHTNGILGDKKKLEDLLIYNRLDTITVSLHSASFWTYNKIVRGGNYTKVKQNLKLYSEMKQNGLLEHFRMIFVVYSENYKEMIDFAKMAKKYNAVAEFWALRKSDCDLCKEFEKNSVVNPSHKNHKDFLKILSSPIFDEDNVILYPEIKSLRNK